MNISALTQRAIAEELAAEATDAWLETLPSPSAKVDHNEAMKALAAARDELGAGG